VPHRDRAQPRALAAAERQAILEALHSARFADLAPAEVWAILLDEGTYLGSQSTFYRLLRAAGETRERRRQATHPAVVKPELAAAGPTQVWSWDITKLHGPAKWTYYHLYVILDIYSRYAVGWMVATRESAVLAEKLIAATCTTPQHTEVPTEANPRATRPRPERRADPAEPSPGHQGLAHSREPPPD
jgi:putative transposase